MTEVLIKHVVHIYILLFVDGYYIRIKWFCKVIQLKHIIEFELEVFFSRLSHLRFLDA
jgi:hypothetical protein